MLEAFILIAAIGVFGFVLKKFAYAIVELLKRGHND